MKLRARAFGIAVGIVGGIALFLATFASLSWGTGDVLNNLSVVMPGHARSAGGAFLGLLWGFVYGFVGGALVAWLYNQFCKVLYKS